MRLGAGRRRSCGCSCVRVRRAIRTTGARCRARVVRTSRMSPRRSRSLRERSCGQARRARPRLANLDAARHARPRRRRDPRSSSARGLDRLTGPPGPALGRGEAPGPDRPPGDRRRRQGRHGQPRDGRRSTRRAASVTSFKVPTPVELAHDYLWRIHQRTPGKGEIAIFNRSHYEDVLVVRVHDFVPKEVWSRATTRSTRSRSC